MGLHAAIDGVDFSPEMLARAAQKQVYRALVQADITRPLALPRQYRGLVSSGTFTAGHVGPEAVPHLLDLALPGAQVALSVNRRVWEKAGFDRALDLLVRQGRIADLHLIEVEVYGAAAAAVDADHASDRALITLFRVT